VPVREERVARRAEALPHDLGVLARDRAHRLPLGLELLQRLGGLDPVGRAGERFGLLAERELRLQVRAPLFGALREERAAPRADLVARRLEPAPEQLGMVARRFGHVAPALVQVPQGVRGLLEVGLRLERLHLLDELLLGRRVGEPLPVVELAQLACARHQRRLQRLHCRGSCSRLTRAAAADSRERRDALQPRSASSFFRSGADPVSGAASECRQVSRWPGPAGA
jgi:hypothetical protein